MAILAAEPSVFPERLFENTAFRDAPNGRRWWVFHTKPRQEKALAREMRAMSIPNYLPTSRRAPDGARKTSKPSYNPLFPAYAFGFLTDSERASALRTGRIANSLEVLKQEEIWSDLTRLYSLLQLGLDVHPVLRVAAGAQVMVRRGPMRGLVGTVERESGKNRFVVRIDFIKLGAAVDLSECDLELISA